MMALLPTTVGPFMSSVPDSIALACALRPIVFAPFERNTHRLISLDERCLVVNTSGSIENWILTAA